MGTQHAQRGAQPSAAQLGSNGTSSYLPTPPSSSQSPHTLPTPTPCACLLHLLLPPSQVGPEDKVCYYYSDPRTIYEKLGHAEVVQVAIQPADQEQQLQEFRWGMGPMPFHWVQVPLHRFVCALQGVAGTYTSKFLQPLHRFGALPH